jgi:hypothetical protein
MPRKKKKELPSKHPSKSHLDNIRSKGIFSTALKAEQFGPHPGYVDTRIRISIYNPVSRQEERLPDKGIELLVSSIEEIDQMLFVMTKALEDWSLGISPYR